MHRAVLKNESIRGPRGTPALVSWGYFQSIIPRTLGSTLCFRKRKRKRPDESISAEKGCAHLRASVLSRINLKKRNIISGIATFLSFTCEIAEDKKKD